MMLSEIGEEMLVTKANITGLIDRLEGQEFMRRIRDETEWPWCRAPGKRWKKAPAKVAGASLRAGEISFAQLKRREA